MKKITIILLLALSVLQLKSQSIGDYRSVTDGNWNNIGIWQVYNGWEWTSASQCPDYFGNNIYVYTNISLVSDLDLRSNLILESGFLNIGENILKLNNNLQINNGELIGGETSNLEINGTSGIISIPQITLNNLTLNSVQGLTVDGELIIKNKLKLINGILNLGNNNLVLAKSAIIDGSFNETTFISGNPSSIIRKYVGSSSTYTFPIGSNDHESFYTPVEIKFINGVFNPGAYIDVSVSNMKQLNISYSSSGYLNRFWKINSYGITDFNCNLFFQYSENDVVGEESEIKCIQVANGDLIEGDLSDVSTNQMLIKTDRFGEFTGASKNWALSSELVKFEAKQKSNSVKVNWTTASEENTKNFEIERSIDGVSFQKIGTVSAAGNSNELLSYSFTDNSINISQPIYYYRLRTIDNDGLSSTSDIIKIEISNNNNNVLTSTFDKSTNQITINYNSETLNHCAVDIIGLNGNRIASNEFELNEGSNKLVLNTDNIATGILIISLRDNTDTITTKLMIY